jgi:hypothetical protein
MDFESIARDLIGAYADVLIVDAVAASRNFCIGCMLKSAAAVTKK